MTVTSHTNEIRKNHLISGGAKSMSPLILLIVWFGVVACRTPVLFWHGFANAYTVSSITLIKENLETLYPDLYIKVLQIGDTVVEDFVNSISMHPDRQIEIACNATQSDERLRDGYVGIGFSQGGLLLRGLAQRCSHPPMKKMITMGTMHQGVYGLPNCNIYFVCDIIRRLYSRLAYTDFWQNYFVQATYWHNPLDIDNYKRRNTFLADINNENRINGTYIDNLNRLEKFVMVKYTKETFVVPSESEWFGYYETALDNQTQTLENSQLYIDDRLGLRRMHDEGKLDFLTVPWEHVEFHWDWFKDNIVDRYL
ncbi:palmitoyl-protein thioesterase 1-like isoform X2 [Photinus pyralis]|uniref:Palmitoyl-protein thioesterase 1 n=2 Tax=Photinus pyralis TaxID=7054 RepID=A0A1Y1KXQ8_PHOPY|nr:palmitoyl-protein thioesterase 1-like isoform X2 [Photinus pyralis]